MNFPVFPLLLMSNFMRFWLENILGVVSIIIHLLRLVMWLNIHLSRRMFPISLRRIYILLLLNELFYICLLLPFGLKHGLSLTFPYWFPSWMVYPLLKFGYWNPLLLLYPCLFLPLDQLPFMPNIFKHCNAWWIHIYNYIHSWIVIILIPLCLLLQFLT